MISEIIPNLYIGTIHDAIHDKTPWSLIICVAEWDTLSDEEHNDLMVQDRPIAFAPFMVYDDQEDHMDCWADIEKLKAISELISVGLKKGKVLVHCAAGIERSPLAVIHYLVKQRVYLNERRKKYYTYETYDDAYAFVKAKRPVIENRLNWLRG